MVFEIWLSPYFLPGILGHCTPVFWDEHTVILGCFVCTGFLGHLIGKAQWSLQRLGMVSIDQGPVAGDC